MEDIHTDMLAVVEPELLDLTMLVVLLTPVLVVLDCK
jgi:hypothetical protein